MLLMVVFARHKRPVIGIGMMLHTFDCRFWTHVVMAYVFTFWTYYALVKEYGTIATMRLHFLASEKRRPDQFTVRSNILFIV